jgi:uncharacterized protein (UPF0276 family)
VVRGSCRELSVAGGPRLAWLEAVRAAHPLSLHGVSLSLAGAEPPDAATLAASPRWCGGSSRRWSPSISPGRGAGPHYLPDLLPFPRSDESARHDLRPRRQVQDALGRPIALENPSHYLTIEATRGERSTSSPRFARRTGCACCSTSTTFTSAPATPACRPSGYVDAFPADPVVEIHLAGHRADPLLGERLLIDSHDAPVAPSVWALFERFVARAGARPT